VKPPNQQLNSLQRFKGWWEELNLTVGNILLAIVPQIATTPWLIKLLLCNSALGFLNQPANLNTTAKLAYIYSPIEVTIS
jgi:hypothetical protein